MRDHRRQLPLLVLTCAFLIPLVPERAEGQEPQTILPDSVSVRRVKCTGWCWEWLTQFLLGPTSTTASGELLLVNWGSEELTVTGIAMVARGDVSERLWVQSYDSLDLGPLPPLHTHTIHLDLSSVMANRSDRYAGEVRLRASGIEESLGTPLFIYTRNGPGRVILTLLLGFLVGRVVIRINESGGTSNLTKEASEHPKRWWIAGRLAGFRWKKGQAAWWVKALALLTGVAWTDEPNAHPFGVRAGLSSVLIAFAVYQGIRVLYLNDLTFGDNGIFDYAAVFAWAATTDGGQRFLTNFKWSPGSGKD